MPAAQQTATMTDGRGGSGHALSTHECSLWNNVRSAVAPERHPMKFPQMRSDAAS